MEKRMHVIGIAGVGMSAVALLLKDSGVIVTGSDAECYGPPAHTLEKAGIPVRIGYDARLLPAEAEAFMVGRNAKLNPQENDEVRAAYASGKPVYSFAQVLGMLTQGRRAVVVVGSYGKSTTTSLLAHILRYCGVDVGYFIGAEPVETDILKAPAAFGSGMTFVLEGDEYPSAHDDTRAKFMHFHATDVVLTSVVHDHVNVYPTFADYKRPFEELLASMPDDGLVVVSAVEPNALALARASGRPLVTYGTDTSDVYATDIKYGATTRFTLVRDGSAVADIETELLGSHNVEDIVAACAYALSRGLVPAHMLPSAIKAFRGVRRRLDRVAPSARVPVFEGFGSSYEKARTAIDAMHLHFPNKNLIVVFEPHTFGWRNRANLSWYDRVFADVAKVYLVPPALQGAATHEQLTHKDILERIQQTGVDVHPYDPACPEDVANAVTENDVVLVLTSGDLEGSLPSLIRAFEERFPL